MVDITTLHRSTKNNRFYATDLVSGEEVEVRDKFPIDKWNCVSAFNDAGIVGYEPMTAKELETEEVQDERLSDFSYFLEEKFDGTRALVYFTDSGCRVFSRRISKKTNFYVENTDSVPQIREICIPELSGTILDGEMFINGLPFKEVSSTLNCLWDRAVDRQLEKGFISLHAFDILFYKGVDLRKMPLHRRKFYLHDVIESSNSRYIEEVVYYSCGENIPVPISDLVMSRFNNKSDFYEFFNRITTSDSDKYPNLAKCLSDEKCGFLTPRAYYELIVATGGEGLIVKPKNGKYYHKRGWEYSKIKKFLTRELIVLGFDEPTKEYTGKDVRKWGFWVDSSDRRYCGNFYGKTGYTPVTKFYYYNYVGNLILGVLIPIKDYNSLSPDKRGFVYTPSDYGVSSSYDSTHYIMQVCECSGFDDETREEFSKVKNSIVGTVVEVKANELFRDSGKMRHPRFLRVRNDKESERCIWEDHIGSSEVTF